jgi:hypothetical protein
MANGMKTISDKTTLSPADNKRTPRRRRLRTGGEEPTA